MMGRSWLYVPGSRPERFAKAADSGADVIICDLEDAVTAVDKASARDDVAAWLVDHRAVVRVNGTETSWFDDDVRAIADVPGLAAVLLPKVGRVEQIDDLVRRLPGHILVVALIESACGLVNAVRIGEHPRVAAMALGGLDLLLDLGIDDAPDPEECALAYPRSMLVVASRAAGLGPPIDTVTTSLTDADTVRRDAERARSLGLAGKQCIHPSQVPTVNAVFTPSPTTIVNARRVVAAAADSRGAAVCLDGHMIDAPRIEQARRILSVGTPGFIAGAGLGSA